MAVAHCMLHQIPPRNFTLPCMLLNETVLSPFSAGVVESLSGLRRRHGASKTTPPLLMDEESFLCCLWNDSSIDCSLYRASMQAKKFIPSEISSSTSQEKGWFSSQGNKKLLLQKEVEVLCWLGGGVCGLYWWVFRADDIVWSKPSSQYSVLEDEGNCIAQFQRVKKVGCLSKRMLNKICGTAQAQIFKGVRCYEKYFKYFCEYGL